VVEEVRRLKEQAGKDILIDGRPMSIFSISDDYEV